MTKKGTTYIVKIITGRKELVDAVSRAFIDSEMQVRRDTNSTLEIKRQRP
jgi:hypothetical protein